MAGVETYVRQKGPRNAGGQFAKVGREVRNLMLRQSLQYQEAVANEITRSIGTMSGQWAGERKKQSSGRLARATRMAGNRYSSPLTWSVGNHSFLDRSTAKYWRTFDKGSLAAGWSFRGKFVMLRPGGFPATRGSVRPFRSFPAGVAPTGRRGNTFRGTGTDKVRIQARVKVTKEIQGHYSYRNVWREQNWPQRIEREFKEVVRRNL